MNIQRIWSEPEENQRIGVKLNPSEKCHKHSRKSRNLHYKKKKVLKNTTYLINKNILFLCLHSASSIPPYPRHYPWNVHLSREFKLPNRDITGYYCARSSCSRATVHYNRAQSRCYPVADVHIIRFFDLNEYYHKTDYFKIDSETIRDKYLIVASFHATSGFY